MHGWDYEVSAYRTIEGTGEGITPGWTDEDGEYHEPTGGGGGRIVLLDHVDALVQGGGEIRPRTASGSPQSAGAEATVQLPDDLLEKLMDLEPNDFIAVYHRRTGRRWDGLLLETVPDSVSFTVKYL